MWRDKLPKTETPEAAAVRRLVAYGAQRAVLLTDLLSRYTRGPERARELRIMAAIAEHRERMRPGDEDGRESPTDTPSSVLMPMELFRMQKEWDAKNGA